MSDDEVSLGQPGIVGRPGQPRPAPGMEAPAAVSQALDASFRIGGSTAPTAEQLLEIRYAHHAVSPVGWMVASGALIAGAVWAINWSEIGPGATDAVRSSEWWVNIYSVLLPANGLRLGSYSPFRMWVTLAVMIAAAATIAGWIGRIGRNLRAGHTPFGSVLAVVALPAWWVLPISIGLTDPGTRSRGDLLVRALIAFGILISQFLLLRWPLLNRIWRAGHLPFDVASIALWLPMMIPWSMFLLSTAFTLMVTGPGEDPSDAAWRPTPAMLDWAEVITHLTEVGVLVLLVVVTAAQHVGIRKDRSEERARREAAATRLPV